MSTSDRTAPDAALGWPGVDGVPSGGLGWPDAEPRPVPPVTRSEEEES